MSSNPQLTAVFSEGEVLTITPETDSLYFPNSYSFYLALLTAVKKADPKEVWNIRYASMVTKENLPFLHSTSRLKVIIDPWAPYRDPIVSLGRHRVLKFMTADSRPHYFKKRAEALPLMEERRAEDTRRKIQSVPTGGLPDAVCPEQTGARGIEDGSTRDT